MSLKVFENIDDEIYEPLPDIKKQIIQNLSCYFNCNREKAEYSLLESFSQSPGRYGFFRPSSQTTSEGQSVVAAFTYLKVEKLRDQFSYVFRHSFVFSTNTGKFKIWEREYDDLEKFFSGYRITKCVDNKKKKQEQEKIEEEKISKMFTNFCTFHESK